MNDKEQKPKILWVIEATDQFTRDIKMISKSHPVETRHMLANARKFLEALNNDIPICNITAGFIHNEPKGIKAMDQKGPVKGKLKQTRLYIYPDLNEKKAHFICAGDKQSQSKDIDFAKKHVDKLNIKNNS